MTDEPDDRDARRWLHQIANLLGVSPTSFFPAERGPAGEGSVPYADGGREAQALALMHLFLALDDSAARVRCLDYVRSEVEQGGAGNVCDGS